MTRTTKDISSHQPEYASWVENTLAQQPESLRRAYQQAAQEIARALSQPIYTTTISIPYLDKDPGVIVLRVGRVFHQVFRKTCRPVLIQKLQQLLAHPKAAIRQSAELTCYLAAQVILLALPDETILREQYTGFDPQGHLAADYKTAAAVVERLSYFVHQLQLVEQIHPRTEDWYSEKHSLLVTHLIDQGRALANYHTRQIIQNILTAWKAGEITRGLTIFLPYLNERQYKMEEYKIVVIPTGRILFRPQFVIGACRVSERHVRSNPDFSQATRWQLLSQLDTIIQTFEAETHFPQ